MGQADAIVCSPPYADQPLNDNQRKSVGRRSWKAGDGAMNGPAEYGTAPGQVGALKSGPCPGGEAEVGDVETLTWGGCYKDSWQGLIVPEAFAHPAKVARGLAVRLFDHGFGRGWWRKNDLVCDPFMGICGFGIIAAYKGLRFVGVELEPRFHALCLENVALHRRRWESGGDPPPICLLGDSREFAKLVGGVTKLLAMWDVYEAGGGAGRLGDFGAWVRSVLAGVDAGAGAALVAGAAGVITSPPYADAQGSPSLGSVNKDGWGHDGRSITARRGLSGDYGTTPGQLGALPAGDADSVVTSPPYAASAHGRNGIDLAKCDRPGAHTQTGAQGYGDTPGNVGGLPAGDADSVVTSPPYEHSLDDPGRDCGKTAARKRRYAEAHPAKAKRQQKPVVNYGVSDGQVGAQHGETYWDAVKCIYGQAYLALKPSGIMAVVVKDFVRAKKRVPLCDQTWRLLLSLGFLPVERIRCLLSEETREPSLFGGEEVRKRSRVSFFRRLATKRGAPEIPFEEILVVRRPPGMGDGGVP